MTFSVAQHDRGLPVALAAEAVAVGHQPLHGESGQLPQPAEVLEVGGERGEAAVLEERPQAELDARAVAQRLVPLTAGAQLGRDVVLVVVLLRPGCRRRCPATASTTATRSLTP